MSTFNKALVYLLWIQTVYIVHMYLSISNRPKQDDLKRCSSGWDEYPTPSLCDLCAVLPSATHKRHYSRQPQAWCHPSTPNVHHPSGCLKIAWTLDTIFNTWRHCNGTCFVSICIMKKKTEEAGIANLSCHTQFHSSETASLTLLWALKRFHHSPSHQNHLQKIHPWEELLV